MTDLRAAAALTTSDRVLGCCALCTPVLRAALRRRGTEDDQLDVVGRAACILRVRWCAHAEGSEQGEQESRRCEREDSDAHGGNSTHLSARCAAFGPSRF